MILFLALLAAIGCAIFNGVAAILEKIGAGEHKITKSIHPGILWKLRKNLPYIVGIVLDLAAWVLTLVAVHNLPLFLAQPIIACSVVVTVLIERFMFKHQLKPRVIWSIFVILAGLVVIAIASTPEKSLSISHSLRLAVVIGPVVLLLIGGVFTKLESNYSNFSLAALSGLAFGGVSIAGRALIIKPPYPHLLYSSLMIAIISYGLVGILFFTLALQRTFASVVSATMIACETLLPIIVGIVFLGDHPKANLWAVVYLGIILTLSGTILIALGSDNEPSKAK